MRVITTVNLKIELQLQIVFLAASLSDSAILMVLK